MYKEVNKSIYRLNYADVPRSGTSYYLAQDGTVKPWTGECATSTIECNHGRKLPAQNAKYIKQGAVLFVVICAALILALALAGKN